jgi:histidyl-tRNA synthetase
MSKKEMLSQKTIKPIREEEAPAVVKDAVASKDAASSKEVVGVLPKGKRPPELLRGFRDVLPDEQPLWEMLRDASRSFATAYSFERLDLPVLEREEVFTRTLGKQTDIIEKEMYEFVDKGGDKVVLRPEGTASVARAYVNHGMLNLPQPVKLYYFISKFLYDRPQAGRYREHHEFGFEVIGSDDAVVDAQLMLMASRLFASLGVEVVMHVNSIGTPMSRQEYKAELVAYYRGKRAQICEDCKRRLFKNPLRLLDCKAEECQSVKSDAPQILDWLDEDSKNHFMQVLEFLDAAEVPYALDPHLVRGLDYYTRTVFEIWSASDEGERAQNALGGGGRYDGLVELLGGREGTAACGFGIGMERVVLTMKELNVAPPVKRPEIFFAQLGDAARRSGLTLFEELRAAGLEVREAFGKNALKAQLEHASKLGVPFTLILGQKEVLDGTIIVRDMDSGAQEIADVSRIVSIMKKKLGETKGLTPTGGDGTMGP